MRVLVGGVGYRDLSDHSFGVLVSDEVAARLAGRRESGDPDARRVETIVEDVSYNPIAVVQRLEDDRAARPFTRAVIVGAAKRPGRDPGELSMYRWDNALPDPEHIQAAVAQAVTGVIALDNLLLVARHFGALPDEVVVVEVEPRREEFGETLSAEVSDAFERACTAVELLALDAGTAARMPLAPLGGGWPRASACGGGADGIVRSW